jgi:glutathione synthase/RimK-type ligase-like ATP-grasp enzyme
MTGRKIALSKNWSLCTVPRLGFAKLVRLSMGGTNLTTIWNDLMERATDDVAGSGMGMDLSVIAQLRGDKDIGLAIQHDTLQLQRIFQTQFDPAAPRLRVLAFATEADAGGNTPIELLLEGQGVELATFYIDNAAPLPDVMPDHDVAIVIAPCTPNAEGSLAAIESLLPDWPRPVLNHPARVRTLERDRLYQALNGIKGLRIPATVAASRKQLAAIAANTLGLSDFLPGAEFPAIVRPFGSHCGTGLSKIEDAGDFLRYLDERKEEDFFISPFIDFSGGDGLFRKYRLALIGGKPFASHMAISDEWKVWYASADMACNVANRLEEAQFMQYFEQDFAARHGAALGEMVDRLGLEYFIIDCAETRQGELLIFEADNSAIVHDLDPPNVFPYKKEHMQKLFAAFVEMLCAHAVPQAVPLRTQRRA